MEIPLPGYEMPPQWVPSNQVIFTSSLKKIFN
jgi:hypothetical protein